MKKTLRAFTLVSLLQISTLVANSDMREWKCADGTTIRAELVTYEEANGRVTLRKEDKSLVELQRNDFTTADQAWLLEWLEFIEEKQALVKQLGGTVERKDSTGKYPTGYSIYRPSGNAAPGTLPMMILFHPGGNGHREIYRYVEAAEAVKMTIVSCDTFQNSKDNPEIEAGYLERFKELLPQIEQTVPHDPKRVFMGGISGGGWRAYHYSAQVSRPWAGIFANCSWVGDEKYWDLPYPKMRVAMVDGDKDYGRYTLEKDMEVINKSGSLISVHSFEGGHQVAPPSVMTKAFRWLLEKE